MTKGEKLLFCKIEKKSKTLSIAGHDSLAKATAQIKNEEQTRKELLNTVKDREKSTIHPL